MRLIDLCGKFIVTPFYYKSAHRATVMCNKVCCAVLNHLKMLQSPKMRETLGETLLLCSLSSPARLISQCVKFKLSQTFHDHLNLFPPPLGLSVNHFISSQLRIIQLSRLNLSLKLKKIYFYFYWLTAYYSLIDKHYE